MATRLDNAGLRYRELERERERERERKRERWRKSSLGQYEFFTVRKIEIDR